MNGEGKSYRVKDLLLTHHMPNLFGLNDLILAQLLGGKVTVIVLLLHQNHFAKRTRAQTRFNDIVIQPNRLRGRIAAEPLVKVFLQLAKYYRIVNFRTEILLFRCGDTSHFAR